MAKADDATPASKDSREKGTYVSSILHSPLRPSISRTCAVCGKRFALRFKQARINPVVGEVRTYRCRACGHEVEYAEHRPTGSL